MPLTCYDISKIMEELAPKHLAETWDNPGLIVGGLSDKVERILVALDATEEVIDEAIEIKADIIVTHHPMLFSGIKQVTKETPEGKKLYKLIGHNIAHYAAHTNLDVAYGGTNDALAEMAGLKNVEVLSETNTEKLFKLSVFVQSAYENEIKSALFKAGAGESMGNYEECSFVSKGIGDFKGKKGAKPFIICGNEGTEEVKIEVLVREGCLKEAVSAMIKVHPYEEPAYDIFELVQKGKTFGIGRIGELENEKTFGEFASGLKTKLGLESMATVGSLDKKVKKVGLCTGAGFSYMQEAAAKGADVYITADIRYHEAQKALSAGLCLIDATHYASENIIVPKLCKYLKEKTKAQVFMSKVDGQVFKFV